MSSNYDQPVEANEVPDWGESAGTEVRCSRCKGLGYVYVHDQETDCIDCEGYGTVVV